MVFVSGKNVVEIAGGGRRSAMSYNGAISTGERLHSPHQPHKGGLMYKRYAGQSCKERKANGMPPVG